MTEEERVAALSAKGFTPRQAAFLATVMLHAGVCLGRQYCAFSSIAYGKNMHTFFQRLVDRGWATARRCGHNRARLYHVHGTALYRAIGDRDNRHRRAISLPRAVEKLMLLDAVLADRSMRWLGSEHDKVRHFTLGHRVPLEQLPALTFPASDRQTATVRYFADKRPIGVSVDGHVHAFLYLVTERDVAAFRMFLENYAELLRTLPEWIVRLVIPRHLADVVEAHRVAFQEQLARPLRPSMRDELHWYFHACRSPAEHRSARFLQARRAFGSARFHTVHRAWLDRGDAVVNATLSPVLADAIERGRGRLESHVLAHRYLHLFPLVGTG